MVAPAVCTSKQSFAPYARRGSSPSSAAELTYCTRRARWDCLPLLAPPDWHAAPLLTPVPCICSFRNSTCCDSHHAVLARGHAHALVQGGASDACFEAWTRLVCALCAPRFGVDAEAPVCASLCDTVHAACRDEYFTTDSHGNLAPCRERDAVCARLEEAAPDGNAVCSGAGFDVVSGSGRWCYSGQQAVNKVSVAARPASKRGSPAGAGRSSWLVSTQSMAVLLAIVMVALHLYRRKPWRRGSSSRGGPSARQLVLAAAEARLKASAAQHPS